MRLTLTPGSQHTAANPRPRRRGAVAETIERSAPLELGAFGTVLHQHAAAAEVGADGVRPLPVARPAGRLPLIHEGQDLGPPGLARRCLPEKAEHLSQSDE